VRSREDQEQAFHLKRSRAHFGQSPHNYYPALAFDFSPSPFVDADWEDAGKFHAIADVIKANAKLHGTSIVWGGDWRTFKDYPHIELEHWRDYLGHTYDSDVNPHDVVEPYDAVKHLHPYK
jgi:peptidoglycan L-alanyl-D-glutamate endopeptidase CwlK